MGNLEFVSIDTWTLIFTWVNLIILFLIVKKILFKPVKKMIDERQAEVDKMYKDAQESVQKAEEMKNDYTKRLSGAKEEAKNIVSNAQKTASENSEKLIKQTQQEISAMKRKADEQIEASKKAAMAEAKGDIASMAVMVAQKVLEEEIDESGYLKTAEKCIEKIGDNQ